MEGLAFVVIVVEFFEELFEEVEHVGLFWHKMRG